MRREITQRQLRNDSGEIMRRLDDGETFTITRNGTPVGELNPHRRRRYVAAAVIYTAFQHAPQIGLDHLRTDVDSVVDQSLDDRG